jgi:hypothetical protein
MSRPRDPDRRIAICIYIFFSLWCVNVARMRDYHNDTCPFSFGWTEVLV